MNGIRLAAAAIGTTLLTGAVILPAQPQPQQINGPGGATIIISGADSPFQKPGQQPPATQPAKAGDPMTDSEAAGPDFKVQGEYEGEGKAGIVIKIGLQVIALGDGKCHAVMYEDGLPGDGANVESNKVEMDGKTEAGKVVLTGTAGRRTVNVTIADGQVTGTVSNGATFSAKKKVRESPTLGAKPPEGSVVLFDGTKDSMKNWDGGAFDEKTGLLNVVTTGGATSKQTFTDCTLHVEFRLPFMPRAQGQERANSGLFLQGAYEIQVLDSFGLEGKNNECGGIYSLVAPKVNMCFPPLSWQTYDIDFTAAKFDKDGKKTANAKITVKHNGVLIHEDQEIASHTADRKPETPGPGPIHLQDHGNPVVYRNVWVVEKK